MNKLSEIHYLPVLFKKVPGRPMLYDPRHSQEWLENATLLESLKIPELQKPYLNNFYFTKLHHAADVVPAPTDPSSVEEALLNFSVEALQLPVKTNDQEYYQTLALAYLAVTEKFLSRHVYGHVASSRHLLLKSIQLKGVGRTVTTQQLSLPNLNGFVHPADGVRTYYNGKLLKASLPYDAVDVQAILYLPDQKLHSCVVVRDAHSHRLAQIEPLFLSTQDRATLSAELEARFRGLSTQQILELILEQHICLWSMGVEHPMNPDNLSLTGLPMDEEDMRPGHELKGMQLDFTIHLDSPGETTISTWDQLCSMEFQADSGVHNRFHHLLIWYAESIAWLRREEVLDVSRVDQQAIMSQVLSRYFESASITEFLGLFTSLQSVRRIAKKQFLKIAGPLIKKGAGIVIIDQQVQFRRTILKLTLPLAPLQDLRSKFNLQKRAPVETIVQNFSRLETTDGSLNGESARANSSQIHRLINRQAFSLGKSLSLSAKDAERYLNQLAAPYRIHSVECYGSEGIRRMAPDEWPDYLKTQGEIILMDLDIEYGDSTMALVTPKHPIRISE